jgi:hypothetical protein
MTEESGGSGLTQKAIHPNVFRLNPDRLCESAAKSAKAEPCSDLESIHILHVSSDEEFYARYPCQAI